MAEKEEKKNQENNFLIKISTIRGRSYSSNLYLKKDDVIVAINNQFYTFGEKKLTEELKELKKSHEKAILTILRGDAFFDVIISNSLGCKFVTTTFEETQKIREQFSSKENFDIDELDEYLVLRDAYRRYEIIKSSTSIAAGLFPPLWLAYTQKWWVLGLFLAFISLLIAVNPFIFLLGWLLTSLYCYKGQLNLLYSFSMLEGKVFCNNIAANSIDHAQRIIRKLDAKSRFKYTKLENPNIEEITEKDNKKSDENNEENIVDEKKEALV